MVVDLKLDPDWTWKLRSVVRRRTGGPHRFDFRVFSGTQVAAKKMKVNDYTSFDNDPNLILYQGWFDKVSMAVHFEENKPMAAPVTVEAAAAASAGAIPRAGEKRCSTLTVRERLLNILRRGISNHRNIDRYQ